MITERVQEWEPTAWVFIAVSTIEFVAIAALIIWGWRYARRG